MRFWRRFEGVFGGDDLWGGGEEEEGRRKRRREGNDEKKGGEGEGDETVFFVCGDEKREKEKLRKERVGRIQKCDWGGFVV